MMRRIKIAVDYILLKLALFFYYYLPVLWARVRLLHRRRDVRDRIAGSVSFPSKRYAVYVLWQSRGVPWYVRTMLHALREQQVNTVVVINSNLTAHQKEILQSECSEILVRGNLGFDFGAYKDAVLYLRERAYICVSKRTARTLSFACRE
jgi:hypothetical protein